jgi:hypothetical protein
MRTAARCRSRATPARASKHSGPPLRSPHSSEIREDAMSKDASDILSATALIMVFFTLLVVLP